MSDIRFDREIRIFRNHGGLLKTGLAIKAGIHPRTLYAMRDAGVVERLDRGVKSALARLGASDRSDAQTGRGYEQ